jgi:hypothetical protein
MQGKQQQFSTKNFMSCVAYIQTYHNSEHIYTV